MSDAEVGRLLAAPDLTTYVGFRDHVMMAVLYQCGLRASELVKLQVGSIHPDGFLIVFGKGNKELLVPMGEHFAGLLDAFVRDSNKMLPGKLNALFLTNKGRPLRDTRSVWVIMRKYRRALGHGRPWRTIRERSDGRCESERWSIALLSPEFGRGYSAPAALPTGARSRRAPRR